MSGGYLSDDHRSLGRPTVEKPQKTRIAFLSYPEDLLWLGRPPHDLNYFMGYYEHLDPKMVLKHFVLLVPDPFATPLIRIRSKIRKYQENVLNSYTEVKFQLYDSRIGVAQKSLFDRR